MYKRFYLLDHQHKSKPFVDALQNHGWMQTSQRNKASFIMADIDHDSRRNYFDYFYNQNKPLFLYPHAARPNLFHDFNGYPTYPHVTACFVTAPGHVDILRIIGDDYPMEVIGWHFCPMKPFQPRKEIRKILFAPTHPNADGSLSTIDAAINAQAYRALLILYEVGEIDLTVRYIRDFNANGLWKVDGVTYIQGNLDLSYKEIDEADLVVSASQTFAYLAMARGVPVIGMGEDIAPHVGNQDKGTFSYSKSFHRYKHIFEYPYDILRDLDTMALFREASLSDKGILDWKRRMLGEPFNPEYFVKRLESYL